MMKCGTLSSKKLWPGSGENVRLLKLKTLPNEPLEWVAFMEMERKTTLSESKEYLSLMSTVLEFRLNAFFPTHQKC